MTLVHVYILEQIEPLIFYVVKSFIGLLFPHLILISLGLTIV